MDSFIFYGDYAKQIQSDNLSQIIGGNQIILDGLQTAAVEECKSYLRQKYDIENAFQVTSQFVKTNSYKAGQTVYLNALGYDGSLPYAIGAQVLQDGNIYQCTTAITQGEPFTKSHWSLIGVQYSTYRSIVPNPIYDSQYVYAIDDKAFWNNANYTCKLTTQILDHEAKLQINDASRSNVVNISPNDPIKGSQYWGVGVSYSVPANTEISNTDYWLPGDARDQKLLEICIKIILYHAHIRISPRNIPELREVNYMGQREDRILAKDRVIYPTYSALGWLQAAATGTDITPQLPMIQTAQGNPSQGRRIRFGGNSKLINQY